MTFNNVGLSDDGFEFDGESSYIEFDGTFFDMNGVTLDVMFKWKGNYTVLQQIVGTDNRFHEWLAIQNDSGYIYFEDGINSNPYQFGTEDDVSLEVQENEWYNLTLTSWEGAYQSYMNGVPTVSDDKSEQGSFVMNAIGGLPDDRRFYGTIKHVSIYNRALTPQEISDRYQRSTYLLE
jgi:hypothetical protein